MRNLILVILFFAATCSFAPNVQALNVQAQRVYIPGSRFFSLVESKPKQQDNLTLQMGMNYALNPFEFGNSATGSRVEGIVDHLFTTDFAVGYSVTDRFALGINAPIHILNHIKSVTNHDQETDVNFGDVSLAALVTILDRDDSSAGFGLALTPFLTFPSGVEDSFAGESTFTGGALLIADVQWGDHYIDTNMGFRFREEENFLNLEIGQEILYGVGYQHYLSQSLGLDGFLETRGSIVVTGLESNSSPFELMVGVSKVISEESPLTIKFGSGVGLGSGYSSPDFRAGLQISYDYLLPHIIKKQVSKTKMVQTVETRLKELTIYYPTDGAKVDPFYEQKISDIAAILKEYPNMAPLYIVSHTDDVATDEYNIALSQERSEKAFQEIVKFGISSDRVVWYGVGEAYPEYPNDSSVNKALNRRTIFTFNKPVYIDNPQAGVVQDAGPATSATPPQNDSYTEVLKEKKKNKTLKEGEYYEEEAVVQKVPVTEQVEVKKKVKQKRKKSKDVLQEEDLSDASQTSDGSTEFDEDL